jgi:hypothetical protein
MYMDVFIHSALTIEKKNSGPMNVKQWLIKINDMHKMDYMPFERSAFDSVKSLK